MRLGSLIFCVVLWWATFPSYAASPVYNVFDLGAVGPTAINDRGQIVGQFHTSSGNTHAFISLNGDTPKDLGTFGGAFTTASAINSWGYVVGQAQHADGATRAFLYNGTSLIDLQTLPEGTTSIASGINNSNQIVGSSNGIVNYGGTSISSASSPFTWSNGSISQLGDAARLERAGAMAINNFGLIVVNANVTFGGFERSVLFAPSTSGSYKEFAVLLPTNDRNRISSTAMNDSGQVVGQLSCDGVCNNGQAFFGTSAFLYSGGSIKILPTLGGAYGSAAAINNAGKIVGSTTFANGVDTAFVLEGNKIRDLNTLVPANTGWELKNPTDINNAGQIVGTGLLNGQHRGFLLSPSSPLPQALVLLNDPSTVRAATYITAENSGNAGFDATKPTIVLTHGWQLCPSVLDYRCPASYTGKTPLASLLKSIQEAPALRNADGTMKANVLTFDWPDAYTNDPTLAKSFIDSAGIALANELKVKLGAVYTQQIHFIGHSYGTLVNAYAASALEKQSAVYDVRQFTLVDAPFKALGGPLVTISPQQFYSLLPTGSVQYVDNYYGTFRSFDLTKSAFGAPLPGAAPGGGVAVLGIDHSRVQSEFYSSLVQEVTWVTPANTDSFAAAAQSEPWAVPSFKIRVLGNIPTNVGDDAWRQLVNVVTETSLIVGSIKTSFLQYVESSPVLAAREIFVPYGSDVLTFNFIFNDKGDGDWLSMFIGDRLVWSFIGTESFNGLMAGMVPVSGFAGTSQTLYVALNSVGARNADVLVGNFQFTTIAAVPEPGTWLLMCVGLFVVVTFTKQKQRQRLSRGPQ